MAQTAEVHLAKQLKAKWGVQDWNSTLLAARNSAGALAAVKWQVGCPYPFRATEMEIYWCFRYR